MLNGLSTEPFPAEWFTLPFLSKSTKGQFIFGGIAVLHVVLLTNQLVYLARTCLFDVKLL
jgi:hypothetical protein